MRLSIHLRHFAFRIVLFPAGFLLALMASAPTRSQSDVSSSANEVNVTSESPPGWTPTPEQIQSAQKVALDYFAMRDRGDAKESYELMTSEFRDDESLSSYSKSMKQFYSIAGILKERRVTKNSWTKDSPKAPRPGVYVAVDFVGQFAQIDRYCGYLILYQPPAGGEFRVMRNQDVYMTNAVARTIEQRNSKAEVENAWRRTSANCPNYSPEEAGSVATDDSAPLPEVQGDTIGYASPSAAMAALKAKEGVEFSIVNGWAVATDNAARTVWSFAPEGYPAYPSVVKRQVIEKDGGSELSMKVLCLADKKPCDDLVRTFLKMNPQFGSGKGNKPQDSRRN